jgi:septal ring factor EnvC (AmiA/AmiB activator)
VEGAVDFSTLAGSLCLPASGPITSRYGQKVHPKFGTVIMQNGIEIGAVAGAPVRAVAPGTVRFADWFRGYGNLVIIDHGGGWFTLYAHLANINVSVGQQVGKNKVIGSVGDTGSMTGANLYFEVRHHQQPQDPAAWLGGC